MDPHEIRQKIRTLHEKQPWNHNYVLPGGSETRPGHQISHGKNLVKLDRLQSIFDMLEPSGKNVLDIGCNEGFFSLHLAGRGANVTGLDIDENRIEKAKFIQSVLNVENVKFDIADIYSEEFRNLPQYDICLCLGFLHRVPDPFRAISSIAEKTDNIIFEWKSLKFGPHNEAFAYFSEKDIDESDYYGTEYWILSFTALERMLVRNGFRHFHRVDDATQRRGILVAGRHSAPIYEVPDVIRSRGKLRSIMSHTKRYVRTVANILLGDMNA